MCGLRAETLRTAGTGAAACQRRALSTLPELRPEGKACRARRGKAAILDREVLPLAAPRLVREANDANDGRGASDDAWLRSLASAVASAGACRCAAEMPQHDLPLEIERHRSQLTELVAAAQRDHGAKHRMVIKAACKAAKSAGGDLGSCSNRLVKQMVSKFVAPQPRKGTVQSATVVESPPRSPRPAVPTQRDAGTAAPNPVPQKLDDNDWRSRKPPEDWSPVKRTVHLAGDALSPRPSKRQKRQPAAAQAAAPAPALPAAPMERAAPGQQRPIDVEDDVELITVSRAKKKKKKKKKKQKREREGRPSSHDEPPRSKKRPAAASTVVRTGMLAKGQDARLACLQPHVVQASSADTTRSPKQPSPSQNNAPQAEAAAPAHRIHAPPALSKKELKRVRKLLAPTKSAEKAATVVATVNAIPLTREKLSCLNDGEWLNEEVINAYAQHSSSSSSTSRPGWLRTSNSMLFSSAMHLTVALCVAAAAQVPCNGRAASSFSYRCCGCGAIYPAVAQSSAAHPADVLLFEADWRRTWL